MKHTKTALHLVFAVLAAAFLTACSSWQADDNDSGYSNSGSGHGGHH
ncbi:MAG: hypothetical protein Q7R35_14610 [Elusimicrobiota bacterium]|nr:hypothetical protein [Elusimicrobiota bacterium]